MEHIGDVLRQMGFERKGDRVVLNSARINESPKPGRITWREMLRGAPECCRGAKSMTTRYGLFRCNHCGRIYERDGDKIVCIQ